MEAIFSQDTLTITGEYIDVTSVFDCGQFFRYFKEEETQHIIAGDKLAFVSGDEKSFLLSGIKEKDEAFWKRFLRLDMSYTETEKEFLQDDVLKRTVPVCHGMRILKQDEFETLISFIISANNNIKRIKKIIEALCARCGKKREVCGKTYFAFPSPENIASLDESDLIEIGAGYRAPYILKTSRAVCDGFDLSMPYNMEYEEAKKYLCSLMGVGPKVADCILLFSYNKFEAFPVDTWVKKLLYEFYDFKPKSNKEAVDFAFKRFGKNAGIAQQYLFHYMRTLNS